MDRIKGHCEREPDLTPDMIEAGVAALVEYSPRFESEEKGVTRIWKKMEAARVSKKLQSVVAEK